MDIAAKTNSMTLTTSPNAGSSIIKEQKKIEEKKAEIIKLKEDLEKKASVLEKSKVDVFSLETVPDA